MFIPHPSRLIVCARVSNENIVTDVLVIVGVLRLRNI